jgi:hypothetical protein
LGPWVQLSIAVFGTNRAHDQVGDHELLALVQSKGGGRHEVEHSPALELDVRVHLDALTIAEREAAAAEDEEDEEEEEEEE